MDLAVLARKAACAVLPRQTTLRRKLPDGTILAGQNRNGYGGRGVFVFGASIEPELSVLPAILTAGDTMIDVGANTGLYSLVAARIVGPSGTVVSFEPNPQMLAALHANSRRNGYGNMRLRGAAASDTCGASSFFENDGKPNSFSLEHLDPGAAGFSTMTITIDVLAEWERLTRVALIKIDAEGSEDKVIAGAAATIDRDRPAIIAEVTQGGLTRLPAGYTAYRATRGPNRVLLPAGHHATAAVQARGWRAVEAL